MDISAIDNYFKTSWLWWLFGSRELQYEIKEYKELTDNNQEPSAYLGRTICSRIEYKIKNKPYSFSDWVLKNSYQSFTENDMYQKYLLIPEELRLFQNRAQGQNFRALQSEYEYFYKNLQDTPNIEEARKLAKQMHMLCQHGYKLSSDYWGNNIYRSILLLPTQDDSLTFDAEKGYIDLYKSHFNDIKPTTERVEEQFSKILDIIKNEKNIGKLRIILPTSERIHIQAPHPVSYDLPKDYFILMQNRLVEALIYRKKHVGRNDDVIVTGGIASASLDTLDAIVREPIDTSGDVAGYLALKKIPAVSLKIGSMFVNKRNNKPILPVELIRYIICSYLAPIMSGNSLMHGFLILFPHPKKYLDLRKNENLQSLGITSVESHQAITLAC